MSKSNETPELAELQAQLESLGEDVGQLRSELEDAESDIETLTDHNVELQATIDTERKTRESAEGGWREANRVIAMQRERLDAQEAEIDRLKGGQGEAVATVVSHWSDWACVNLRINGKLRMYVESCKPEQPAPASVVLPERLDLPHRDEFESADQYAAAVGESKKWNECLDKVKELNQ